MDLTFTEEQDAVVAAASTVLAGTVDHASLKDLERSGEPILDRRAWSELARAGLLGIALPAEHGGAGLGMVEAALVLDQIGRAVAPVPYLTCIVGAAMPIERFGTVEQRARWLPGVIDGSVLLTAALADHGVVTASPTDAGGYRLDGERWFVPWADDAERILVPATTSEGEVVVLLADPAAPGVTAEVLLTTHGLPEHRLGFDGVEVDAADVIADGARGAEVLGWTRQRHIVGLCALQAGVCAGAVALTSTYTSERQQFGVPIATFQAVAHRAADAHIDAHAVYLTTLQAAWRLDAGLDAGEETHIAAYWATEGAQRAVHAAQHLHGGIGVDTDYPLHRYFRWAKVLELTMGGTTTHLRALGRSVATSVGVGDVVDSTGHEVAVQ